MHISDTDICRSTTIGRMKFGRATIKRSQMVATTVSRYGN